MDIRKGKINISVSVLFKVLTLLLGIFVRRVLIQFCGNEVNGLNALFLSIIGLLSVAELGVGTAITYSMYKPIINNDKQKVAALYCFFQKTYRYVGLIIFLLGLVLTPFLKAIAKDYDNQNHNIYLSFLIILISIVITYLSGAKLALINAYKNNYISTSISQGCVVLQYLIQLVVLYITKSFELYLMCRIIGAIVQMVLVEYISRKMYGDIIKIKAKVDEETNGELKKNIKAMFMHRIGKILVNSMDGIIISAFIGVISLGEYSNYAMILSSMNGIIVLVFSSLTSIVGHMATKLSKTSLQNIFEIFHLGNYVIGALFFLGYYAVIDSLISIVFSPDLIVDNTISIVITINGFVQYMRESTFVFREATGQFYADRWKPLCEGVCNIVLSVILVNWIGVVGVIGATIITNLLICHIVEPYVLFKNVFKMSPFKYYLLNYSMILCFIFMVILMDFCMIDFQSRVITLMINGIISVCFSFCFSIPFVLVKHKAVMKTFSLLKG